MTTQVPCPSAHEHQHQTPLVRLNGELGATILPGLMDLHSIKQALGEEQTLTCTLWLAGRARTHARIHAHTCA